MADKDNNNYNVSGLNPDLPETFLNPADKKNIPKKIQHFENLISEFSTVIIDTPEEYLEDELSHWLKIFVEFLRVDRCIVNEYQDDQKVIRLLLDYTVPEVDVDPLVKDYKTSEDVFRELKKGNIIKVEKIPEDLPQAFRGGLIERERTKSIIIFPLSIGYKIFGSFLFSSFRKRYNWSDDFVRKMKLIGEIIANTILRIRSHKKFLHEMEQRKSLEKRYSAILKDANVGFIILDLNHNILEVNDEYCRMSGYNREELLTKKIWEIDASMDPEKLGKEARVLEKERVIRIITSHRRKDGSLFDVEVSSNFIEEEGIACTFVRDITDLSKAREQMEKRLEFEELVSGFSAELINIAPDHIYDELNKWLKKFVEFLKVDRGIVVEHLYEENMIHLLLNYTVPEINVPLVYSHKPPTSIRENIKRGLTIKAEKIPDDLPEALKGGIIERENTKSIIIVPITASNKVIGNLTFLNYRKERKWPDELVSRIKLIGEILANAIMRERSHKTLLKETENRKLIEEKYALVLENANVGFWMLDFNRNILEVNDEYCRMSGYSRDELLSMKVVDIVVNKEPDRESWFLKRMKSEGSVHHEITHLKKDGSLLELDVSSALLGENILFSFMRDITELNQSKREREERLKFEKLISEFSAALVNVKVNDIKMKLDIWLKRFAQLLNIDRCSLGQYEDDLSRTIFISTYINPDLEKKSLPFPKAKASLYGLEKYLKKGKILMFESADDVLPDDLQKWRKELLNDGTKSVLMLPLISGDLLLGNIVISTMIKERKWTQDYVRRLNLVAEIFSNALMREKTEKELDNYRKHLEKMVDERTAELKDAQKELVLNEKMATLGKLTATVSHELRNPLGTIRSSVFSVQRRLKYGDIKVMNALDRAERNIHRCDLIIDELLQYSRVHNLKLEPTQIDAWIEGVLDETGSPDNIYIEKELNSGATINIDQERFRRSMINIQTNAYQAIQEKRSDEPGYVRIKTHQDINHIIIEVSDNGVGFNVEDKNKFYEPLYSTKTYGVGLGIPITRQIIEQHGWTMDITGESQKGASVIITIPY